MQTILNFFASIWAAILSIFGIKSQSSVPVSTFPLSLGPNSAWSITEGSSPQAVTNGTFAFPAAPSASTAWVSYVEVPLVADLSSAHSISLTYTITGDSPVFVHDSPNNTSDGSSNISLLLHQAGDNLSGLGAFAFYRWFATPEGLPLDIGTHTITVPLSVTAWVPVYNSDPVSDATGFTNALKNMGSVGFVFGGGSFAGHGVAVSSGSAVFNIISMQIT